MSGAVPRAAALACLILLSGCFLSGDERVPRVTGIVYSPNGEPLSGGPLGDPKCADAIGRWFERVDTNHDGTIELDEFLADAARQFGVMDLDKRGVLTPAELAQYRAPYLADQRRQDERAEDEERNRERRNGNEPPRSLDQADPVMLADTGLRNEVTRDQFLAYERANFSALDRDHSGRVPREAFLTACKDR